jgi:hypothetical protein
MTPARAITETYDSRTHRDLSGDNEPPELLEKRDILIAARADADAKIKSSMSVSKRSLAMRLPVRYRAGGSPCVHGAGASTLSLRWTFRC